MESIRSEFESTHDEDQSPISESEIIDKFEAYKGVEWGKTWEVFLE